MYTSQSQLASAIFSFLTFLVAIPSAIKIFNWVSTLYKGVIEFTTPFLYMMAFIFLFIIGGVTGVVLGVLNLDVHLHDTYFVVAHFHYVMVGGTVIALFGGLHYWWPKIWGRMYNEILGYIAFFFVFVGFNLTFFTQFIMGTKGMPRRYYTYLPEFQTYHQISTVGSWLIALGVIIMFTYLLNAIFNGKPAGNNPWGAKTLEWSIESPPTEHNFHDTPRVTAGPYDYPSRED